MLQFIQRRNRPIFLINVQERFLHEDDSVDFRNELNASLNKHKLNLMAQVIT